MGGLLFGTSSANPEPAAYGAAVDRNPVLTPTGDALIIQSEDILHEVATHMSYRVRRSLFRAG